MTRLEGKVALVTGGARGIGRAVCEAYAREGAKVAVADVLDYAARDTAGELGDCGMAVKMDVTNMQSILDGVGAVEEVWGGIDILVNGAGIFNMASIDKITHADYRRQYDVNVGGTIFVSQRVVPLMERRGGGAIINFSSQAGRRGEDILVQTVQRHRRSGRGRPRPVRSRTGVAAALVFRRPRSVCQRSGRQGTGVPH